MFDIEKIHHSRGEKVSTRLGKTAIKGIRATTRTLELLIAGLNSVILFMELIAHNGLFCME